LSLLPRRDAAASDAAAAVSLAAQDTPPKHAAADHAAAAHGTIACGFAKSTGCVSLACYPHHDVVASDTATTSEIYTRRPATPYMLKQ
jgi:hypothetical protein